MRTAVIGAGALGLLLGGVMAGSGGDVLIYTRRREAASVINREGVVIRSPLGERASRPLATDDPSLLSDAGLAVIALKSYDTRRVASRIAEHLSPRCLVLTLQNGLGNVEGLMETLGAGRVLGGVTSQASTLLGLNEVFHAYSGETVIGEPLGGVSERAEATARLLTALGVPSRVSPDLYREIWLKLAVNSVINPLTAILRVRNGELLSVPGIDILVKRVVEECAAVAAKRGVRISEDEALRLTYRVMEGSGMNKSSMLQDIENGRSTEIDYLNGEVARLAAEAGLGAPVNENLTTLVKALEHVSRRR